MQLTADQELRRELLLFSLSKHSDLGAAIKSAAEMERFVLRGSCAEEALTIEGNEEPAGHPTDTRFSVRCETPSNASHHIVGEIASPPAPRGTARKEPAADEWDEGHSACSKRRWTEADDQTLRRLWHSNHSLEEIAEAMVRTTPSLYSRARALGMSKRSPVNTSGSEHREGLDDAAAEVLNDRYSAPGGAKPAEPSLPGKPRAAMEEKRQRPHDGLGDGKRYRSGHLADASSSDEVVEVGVDPIVHFLRSRDYSVVRVEGGRFRVDGRRILSAEELRQKANQVRLGMGKPPFAPQPAGAAR